MPLRIIHWRTGKLWAISTWAPLVEGCTGGGYHLPHTSGLHMHAYRAGSESHAIVTTEKSWGRKWISHSPHQKHHQVDWNAQSCLLQTWQESGEAKSIWGKHRGGWYTEYLLLTLCISKLGFWSRGLYESFQQCMANLAGGMQFPVTCLDSLH